MEETRQEAGEMTSRKCKICRQPAIMGGIEPVCSMACALKLAARKREKSELVKRREVSRLIRERKAKFKTRNDHLKEAQALCNKFIRLRDADKSCVSCGCTNAKWDAGHFKTTSSRAGLRFHPANIHKQCYRCNTHLSGNIHEYRRGLIAKVGQEMVDYLDNSNPFSAWNIEEIIEIKGHFKELIGSYTVHGNESNF